MTLGREIFRQDELLEPSVERSVHSQNTDYFFLYRNKSGESVPVIHKHFSRIENSYTELGFFTAIGSGNELSARLENRKL